MHDVILYAAQAVHITRRGAGSGSTWPCYSFDADGNLHIQTIGGNFWHWHVHAARFYDQILKIFAKSLRALVSYKEQDAALPWQQQQFHTLQQTHNKDTQTQQRHTDTTQTQTQ